MGYVVLEEGVPDADKMVISLWFRVPHTSIQRAAAEPIDNQIPGPPILRRCIPLLTFGKQVETTELIPTDVNLVGPYPLPDTGNPGPYTPSIAGFTQGRKFKLDPCYIAIDCSGDNPVLAFNLQTRSHATGTAVGAVVDAAAVVLNPQNQGDINRWQALSNIPGSGYDNQFYYYTVGGVIFPANYHIRSTGITDFSADVLNATPELYYVKTVHPITPDHWHHLLLSFDISKPIITRGPPTPDNFSHNWVNVWQGTKSYAKMWYAIDDVDYRGRTKDEFGQPQYHLGPYCVDRDSRIIEGRGASKPMGDPNGILTKAGWEVPYFGSVGTTFGNQPYPVPTYDFPASKLPSWQADFGLPATPAQVAHVYHVEMAEFQLFTGVTLDTKVTGNRRAFIDPKLDAKGKPVRDASERIILDPVPPAAAAKRLGKRPEVLLHGCKKWIAGENTGSLGVDGKGKKIREGQLLSAGEIVCYTPDPNIFGPQGDPQ